MQDLFTLINEADKKHKATHDLRGVNFNYVLFFYILIEDFDDYCVMKHLNNPLGVTTGKGKWVRCTCN